MKKILFITASSILISCNQPAPSIAKTYDYSDIEDKCSWSEVFEKEEDYYLVYFYSLTCGHCFEIKQEMISFYFDYDEKIYFSEVNKETVFGPKADITGINRIEDFYIFGTPFLVEIEKWAIKNYYAGTTKILEFINYLNF